MGRIIVPTQGIRVRGRSPFLDRPGIPFVGGGGGGSTWTPNNVTQGIGGALLYTWEALDVDGPLYAEAYSPTTLVTANNAQVGAMPTMRFLNQMGYGWEYWKPQGNNMAGAPILVTTDPSYNRVLKFVGNTSTLVPNGDFYNQVLRGKVPTLHAMRFKQDAPNGVAEIYFGCVDNSPLLGPGFAITGYTNRVYVTPNQDWMTDTGYLLPLDGQWHTVIVYSDNDGTRVYIDDPNTPIYNNGALVPNGTWQGWRTMAIFPSYGYGSNLYFRRAVLGSNFDPTQMTIPDLFAWLEG